MARITDIYAREILDSRGEPTIEVVVSDANQSVTASVPAGDQISENEAYELRDNDLTRYHGKGVLKAIANINGPIKSVVVGNWDSIVEIDQRLKTLDGTENKSRLGANAILAVSLACARLFALQEKQPLYLYLRNHFCFDQLAWKMPLPIANVINGGAHIESGLDFQEFWIIPQGIKSYFEQLRALAEIFHQLGFILEKNNLSTNITLEGGYVPKLESNSQAWQLIEKAVKESKYSLGKQIFFGFDARASFWYKPNNENDKIYLLPKANKYLTVEELNNKYLKWFGDYPFLAVEDLFDQNDWSAWQDFTKTLSVINNKLTIIGDDLFKTNLTLLNKGVSTKSANSIVIKPSQVGTLSETIACIRQAQASGWQIVISHLSGETVDDFIADLAVAVSADFVKFGSPASSERLAKYNRLLVIEQEIKGKL